MQADALLSGLAALGQGEFVSVGSQVAQPPERGGGAMGDGSLGRLSFPGWDPWRQGQPGRAQAGMGGQRRSSQVVDAAGGTLENAAGPAQPLQGCSGDPRRFCLAAGE